MPAKGKSLNFHAKIYAVGVNRCVDVPARVSRALGPGGHLPVRGTIGGEQLRSRLVPRGGGLFRLFIHSRIWKKLGVDVGDVVSVSLTTDPQGDRVRLPWEIAAAFPRGSRERAAFDAETAATRRRFIAWVTAARTTTTRDRRIKEFTAMILAKHQSRNR